MKHLGLALKNKESNPKSWIKMKEAMIEKEIRKKYSLNDELAILRQRDTKPEEYAEYNAYVEACKTSVKTELGEV